MQAIFSGRAPQCSGWTPGGATASVTTQNINDANTLLAQIKAFVGEPTDFATGAAGTMMFDVVAAAHLFPEYFWIGNSYSNFMAFGWGEEAGIIPLTGVLGAIFTQINNSDNRASRRGWKSSAAAGAPVNAVDIMKIGESIAGSRYNKTLAGKYLDGSSFKHPWDGIIQPKPLNEYSWLKSPRYNISATPTPNYQPFEVGPLARMVVQGTCFAGILNVAGYPLAPVAGAPGPNLTGPHTLSAVYALIPGVTGGPNLSGVAYNGDSVLDRIAARAIECRLMIDMAAHFLGRINSTIDTSCDPDPKKQFASTGITDDTVPVYIALAAIGVAALLFTVTAQLGYSVLVQLARYVGVVLLGLILHQFVVYSLSVKLLGGMSPVRFFRGISDAMLTAFSTSSSSATLPTALKVAEENLHLPPHISRFVLTVGSTANQNGTALFEGVTVLFLAQLYGVHLSFGSQVLVVALCILGGIGTAGVPAGSLPVVAMILGMVGVPVEGIGLVLGVDRFLDMCRTTLNVSGDLAAAVVVARSESWTPPPADSDAPART